MKKFIYVVLILSLLSGCSQTSAETPEIVENNEVTVSNDYESGTVPLVEGDISCEVPSSWTVTTNDTTTYCYPPNSQTSFLMTETYEISGSIFDDETLNQYLDGLSQGFGDFDVLSTGETENEYGSKGKNVQFTGEIENVRVNVDLVVYDSLGGISSISMLTDSESKIDYSSDFDKIVQSVLVVPRVDSQTGQQDTNIDKQPTLGESNALSKALSYLDYMAFSAQGIKEQLQFEGFTENEAQYAVDNCGADWNEQAAKKAQSYMKYSSFSRQGLIDQLKFEGFTQEQAEYGVTDVGY